MRELKFELQITKTGIQKYERFLVSNDFQFFENSLADHFYHQISKILDISYIYSDWLVLKLRLKINREIILIDSNSIYSHYLENSHLKKYNFEDQKSFIYFLKLLDYVTNLEFQSVKLSSNFRKVTFPLRDFWEFVDEEVDSNSYYQYKKIIQFFEFVQNNFFIKSFSENYFRSIAAIPELKLYKSKRVRMCTLWFSEELVNHIYPFYLPDMFHSKLKKHKFQVSFYLFQIFSLPEIQKRIDIPQFLNDYPASLSPNKIISIKKYFIDQIEDLKTQEKIEDRYKIISNGVIVEIKKLTIQNISEGVFIYEKLLYKKYL